MYSSVTVAGSTSVTFLLAYASRIRVAVSGLLFGEEGLNNTFEDTRIKKKHIQLSKSSA